MERDRLERRVDKIYEDLWDIIGHSDWLMVRHAEELPGNYPVGCVDHYGVCGQDNTEARAEWILTSLLTFHESAKNFFIQQGLVDSKGKQIFRT